MFSQKKIKPGKQDKIRSGAQGKGQTRRTDTKVIIKIRTDKRPGTQSGTTASKLETQGEHPWEERWGQE